MRIISGKYKGRKINPPVGFRARPTTDYARESLFNILLNRIDFEYADVLDLFSGTGSISFEFASRGAKSVTLVEKDFRHYSFIRKVISELSLEQVKAIHSDVKTFLKHCSSDFDIVFADPPYTLPWLKQIPDLIENAGILKDRGFFILEHPASISFSGHKSLTEHREYGSVNFSFFSFSVSV